MNGMPSKEIFSSSVAAMIAAAVALNEPASPKDPIYHLSLSDPNPAPAVPARPNKAVVAAYLKSSSHQLRPVFGKPFQAPEILNIARPKQVVFTFDSEIVDSASVDPGNFKKPSVFSRIKNRFTRGYDQMKNFVASAGQALRELNCMGKTFTLGEQRMVSQFGVWDWNDPKTIEVPHDHLPSTEVSMPEYQPDQRESFSGKAI